MAYPNGLNIYDVQVLLHYFAFASLHPDASSDARANRMVHDAAVARLADQGLLHFTANAGRAEFVGLRPVATERGQVYCRALMSVPLPTASWAVQWPADAPPRCDHKFVDSPHCLKCGWTPPADYSNTRAALAKAADTASQSSYLGNNLRTVAHRYPLAQSDRDLIAMAANRLDCFIQADREARGTAREQS